MAVTLDDMVSCSGDRDNRLCKLERHTEAMWLNWLKEVVRRASLREAKRLCANQACMSMQAVDAGISITADVSPQDAISQSSHDWQD